MAVNKNSTLLFLMRLAGLTGLLVLVAGLVLWLAIGTVTAGLTVAAVGALLLLVAAVVEMQSLLGALRSQRGAMGTNVAVQIVLALALLVGINVFSFLHYQRFDWTSDRLFTIDKNVRRDLEQLRGQTDIVVYLRNASSQGQATDNKLAHFQAAAQRRIVEKVKDLVDEFQQLGPRFHVEVLNVEEEDYEPKLRALKNRSEALGEALEKAPENSIFFSSQGRVQRLGFNDVYQLDSEASLAANDKKGNLILNYQGEGPFARKILNLEEKKPRVGLAVVHEILSMDDSQDPRLTMSGAKKVLTSYGFETRDIILKKWSDMGPEPTVYTFDESRFEGLEDQRVELEANIKVREKELKELGEQKKIWKDSTIAELNKRFAVVLLPDRAQPVLTERERLASLDKVGRKYKLIPIDEEDRADLLKDIETNLTLHELSMGQEKKELAAVVSEQKDLKIDNLAEQRRITDLGAKMKRLLTDVDLLIVPRTTFLDIPRGDVIINRAHKLDEAQLDAVKEFIKAGKPVLFLLGPANERKRDLEMPDFSGPDPLEGMLADLGFKMPKQTILFNVETKSFAERRGNLIIQGTQVEVPPVEFDWKPGAGLPGHALASKTMKLADQPIRSSVRLAGRSVGKGEAMDLRLRHPRPIYYLPRGGDPKVDHTLIMATAESWNEDNPFPSRERTPRFELPKKEPENVEDKRRGPFPIAAAADVDIPATWFDKSEASPHKDRVAVIGHGGVFVGPNLTPIRQKLLLDTCNWLLGRDDLLATEDKVWQYPRLALSETQQALWHWGTVLGMPLLFVYLGVLVFMVRRMR
jgi:hypothetical protein